MSKLPCVAIDPYLLILPEPCYSTEDIIRFAKGLLDWSVALSDADTEYVISDLCLESMFLDGWYPYTGRISRLVQKFGQADALDFIDESTLIRLAQKVLERTPRLEEKIGIEAILFDQDSISIEPQAITERLGENTSLALKESLAMLGLGLTHLTTMPNGCVFASLNGHGCKNLSEVDLEVTVEEVAFSDLPSNTLQFPLTFSETLAICHGHDDYIQQVHALELWGQAEVEKNILVAIMAKAMEHKRIGLPIVGTSPSYSAGFIVVKDSLYRFEIGSQFSPNYSAGSVIVKDGLYRFRFGSQFLASIQKWGFGNRQDWAMLLIDTCARILLGVPKNEVKPFRISAKSDVQRQRKADNAFAWRAHLTKANAGFRLLLWTTPDGVIEFANIGPKKELLIEE